MPGIIVGVDGSGHSQRALEWAMKEAAVRHVPLTVLTVHPSIVGYFGGVVTTPQDLKQTEQVQVAVRTEADKTTTLTTSAWSSWLAIWRFMSAVVRRAGA